MINLWFTGCHYNGTAAKLRTESYKRQWSAGDLPVHSLFGCVYTHIHICMYTNVYILHCVYSIQHLQCLGAVLNM